jgi:hypothetical protein
MADHVDGSRSNDRLDRAPDDHRNLGGAAASARIRLITARNAQSDRDLTTVERLIVVARSCTGQR